MLVVLLKYFWGEFVITYTYRHLTLTMLAVKHVFLAAEILTIKLKLIALLLSNYEQ